MSDFVFVREKFVFVHLWCLHIMTNILNVMYTITETCTDFINISQPTKVDTRYRDGVVFTIIPLLYPSYHIVVKNDYNSDCGL